MAIATDLKSADVKTAGSLLEHLNARSQSFQTGSCVPDANLIRCFRSIVPEELLQAIEVNVRAFKRQWTNA
jgi:hypothetical protein